MTSSRNKSRYEHLRHMECPNWPQWHGDHFVAFLPIIRSLNHLVLSRRVERISKLGMLAVTSNRHTLRRLLVMVNGVPSSPILVTLMTEALSSSETSVLTRGTRRNMPEDTIHQTISYSHSARAVLTSGEPQCSVVPTFPYSPWTSVHHRKFLSLLISLPWTSLTVHSITPFSNESLIVE
jgi:hypothetical protein